MELSKLTNKQIGEWADIVFRSGKSDEVAQLLRHSLRVTMAAEDIAAAPVNGTGGGGHAESALQREGGDPRALELPDGDSENPSVLRNIGVALTLVGRMEEAIEYFERALKAQAGRPPGSERRLSARNGNLRHETTSDCMRFCPKLDEGESDHEKFDPNGALLREEIAGKPSDASSRMRLNDRICREVIRAFRNDKSRILRTIANSEEKLKAFTNKRRSIPPDAFSFFSVLRKWNSYTPILPSEKGDNQGGGYFLHIAGKNGREGRGIVIDPGFNFVENFYEEGFKAADIDAVLISHAHNDHTVDLEAILTLIHKINDNKLKRARKKIDLFLNLGTFQKYSGWLNIQSDGNVGEVKVLHAGNTYDLSEKYNGLKIHAIKAEHDEVIADQYSLGFILELEGCKIAMTGDTGWKTDNSVAAPYLGHEIGLMVAHLGSIKKVEFDYLEKKTDTEKQKCFYPQHLGLLGVGAMLNSAKPKLAVISEFGEELKTLRKEVAEKFDEILEGTKCIPGEVGLHIRVPDLSVYCIVHRDFVPFEDIHIFGRPDQSNLYYHKDLSGEKDKAEIHDLARELAAKERTVSLFERLKRGPVTIR